MKLYLSKSSFLNIFFLFFLTLECNKLIFSRAFSLESKKLLDPLERFKEIEKSYSKSPYIIDSGDVLSIEFGEVTIFSNNYAVDADGYINLPEFGPIFTKGISIKELEELLNSVYGEYISSPSINVYIFQPREVNVYVKGEVNFPGLYQLSYKQSKITSKREDVLYQESKSPSDSTIFNNSIKGSIVKPPRIFNALQATKGLKSSADISKITVIRDTSKLNGGGKVKTELNFLSLIENGDQSQNIELRDKDVIIIPKSDRNISKQFLEINKTNLTPNEMVVFVNGNVKAQGAKVVPKDSSLNQVLTYSGGIGISYGKIEFLRLDDSGNLKKKLIKYDLKAPKGSKNNPTLVNGDVIMVRKNIGGKVSSALNEFSTPIFSAYGLYRLFY